MMRISYKLKRSKGAEEYTDLSKDIRDINVVETGHLKYLTSGKGF